MSEVIEKQVVSNKVVMSDGRIVEFGKRKMLTEVILGDDDLVSLRVDFANGETRTLVAPNSLKQELVGHGLMAKAGSEAAGCEAIADKVKAVDALAARLAAGQWSARSADGPSTTHVVIRALSEHLGKSHGEIKAYVDGKVATAAAQGQKVTHQALYAQFRKDPEVGAIIARLEAEKASPAPSASDMLTELANS